MSDALTYGIEAAVGVACLGAATGAWRRAGLRALAGLLAIAGVVAIAHAAASLT